MTIPSAPGVSSNPISIPDDISKGFARFRIRLPENAPSSSFWAHCPECFQERKKKKGDESTTPSLLVFLDDSSWVCHHCQFQGSLALGPAKKLSPMDWRPKEWRKPKLISSAPPPGVLSWFQGRGISKGTLDAMKVSCARMYSSRTEDLQPTICFPYMRHQELVNIKYRDPRKRFRLEPGAEPVFYGFDDIVDECTIIVEAEIDKLSFLEAGTRAVIGVPYTPSPSDPDYEDNFDYLVSAEQRLSSVKKFIIAVSSTEAGRKLEEELARRLGKERCWRVQWPDGLKDANEVLAAQGAEALKTAVDSARPFPIKGIFEAMDVSDKIDSLYDFGLPRGVDTGWKTLNDYYTVKEGQWTLVTGIPGHGKSNLLDAMLVNIALDRNWRFGMFSPENQPIERHFASLMEKHADAPFNWGPTKRMDAEQKDKSKLWVNEHFFVILPDEDEGNWTIDGILTLAKALVFRKGIKGLVVDPWNELDHSRAPGVTETEHISQALSKIRQFARAHSVHVWVVAHPAKLYKDNDGRYPVPTPYDVSGSSHWNNKADNALSVWRNRGGKDEDIADVHIQKIRFKEVGRVGVVSLRFNKATGRFLDDIDQDKRLRAMEEGIEIPSEELRVFSSPKKHSSQAAK